MPTKTGFQLYVARKRKPRKLIISNEYLYLHSNANRVQKLFTEDVRIMYVRSQRCENSLPALKPHKGSTIYDRM